MKEEVMFEDLKTPVEIDSKLAELYYGKYDLENEIANLRSRIEMYAEREYYASSKAKVESKLEEVLEKYKVLLANVQILNKKYTGWSRAFLVSNSNGHIHASQNCSTCFPSTRYIWLTDLSGQDRLEIAGLAGEKACSVCYPDAPSEYFQRKCQLEDPAVVKAREERAVAKAEREAKRIAVGISNPDGSNLLVRNWWDSLGYKENLKTERTARIWVKNHLVALSDVKEWQKEKFESVRPDIEKVLIAIAHKNNQSVEVVRAEIEQKANKEIAKIARDLEVWYQANPQHRPEK
jgi:hypothetical protein